MAEDNNSLLVVVAFFCFHSRTMVFRLVAHYKIVYNVDSESDFDSDAYIAIAPPETPISLRSSL